MNPAGTEPKTPKCQGGAGSGAAVPAIRALQGQVGQMSAALERVEEAVRSRGGQAEVRARWFQNAPLAPRAPSALPPGSEPGLLARWGSGISSLWRSFDEDAYLYFNPDVLAAAAGRDLNPGFLHWMKHGRREGRAGGAPLVVEPRGRAEGEAGLNVYGFFSTVSGLGAGARGLKMSAEASGLAGEYLDLPNWESAASASAGVRRGRYRTNLLLQNADVLPLFVRTYGQRLLTGRYNIAHCAWELPSLRGDFAGNLRLVDEIWTVSEFARAAYQAATPLPVHVIPNTVNDLDRAATLSRADLGLPEGVFLFSYVFDVSSGFERKNPLALLEAFRAEFGDSRDVLLLLKCFNGKYNPERLERLRRQAAAGNIRLVEEVWTDAQIHSLHKVTDCFVSPHRSEGFGLNMAETMYFGNAVVGTNYSGNTEFMDESNSYPAACRLVEIEESTGPYLKGSVWAEVDPHDLARQMRRALEDPAERRRRGAEAARTIRSRFSAEAVGRLIRTRMEEIDQPVARHPEPRGRFLPEGTRGDVRTEVRGLRVRPRISVITPVRDGNAEWLRRCVDSVRAQWYPYWELCLSDDGSTRAETRAALAAYQGADPRIKVIRADEHRGIAAASNRAAEFATGEWLALLDQSDELAPDALLCVARAAGRQPDLDVLYSDEDRIDEAGRHVDPCHKPDWSPEYLQSEMYLRRLLVVRKRLFWDLGGFRPEMDGAHDYDLVLRLTGRTNRVGHVAKVVYHRREDPGVPAVAPEAGRRALADFIGREGLAASVEPGLAPGLFRVKYEICGKPRVTLVIVADGEEATPGQVPVENLVRSIVARTAYPNYEILVTHDGRIRGEVGQALRDMGCRVEDYSGLRRPDNEAHRINWSLRQARTELVVLLSDQMEVVSPEWLEALLEYAQQPWVGAAGGQLAGPAGPEALLANAQQPWVGAAGGKLAGSEVPETLLANAQQPWLGAGSGQLAGPEEPETLLANAQQPWIGAGSGQLAGSAGPETLLANARQPWIGAGSGQLAGPAGRLPQAGGTSPIYCGPRGHAVRNCRAVTSACLATRMSVFEEMGGFDEQYGAAYSDVDYCFQLIERGYRIVYTPYSELCHYGGRSVPGSVQAEEDVSHFRAKWVKYLEADTQHKFDLSRTRLDCAGGDDGG